MNKLIRCAAIAKGKRCRNSASAVVGFNFEAFAICGVHLNCKEVLLYRHPDQKAVQCLSVETKKPRLRVQTSPVADTETEPRNENELVVSVKRPDGSVIDAATILIDEGEQEARSVAANLLSGVWGPLRNG